MPLSPPCICLARTADRKVAPRRRLREAARVPAWRETGAAPRCRWQRHTASATFAACATCATCARLSRRQVGVGRRLDSAAQANLSRERDRRIDLASSKGHAKGRSSSRRASIIGPPRGFPTKERARAPPAGPSIFGASTTRGARSLAVDHACAGCVVTRRVAAGPCAASRASVMRASVNAPRERSTSRAAMSK